MKKLITLLFILTVFSYASANDYADILSLSEEKNLPPYVKEVITINLRSQIPPDMRMRRAFWFALNDYKPFTSDRVDILRLTLVGKSIELLSLFYEDTLAAIETNTEVKSQNRADLEAKLLMLGIINETTISSHKGLQERLIEQANNDKIDGETESIIRGFLEILNQSKANMDVLFLPIPTTMLAQ